MGTSGTSATSSAYITASGIYTTSGGINTTSGITTIITNYSGISDYITKSSEISVITIFNTNYSDNYWFITNCTTFSGKNNEKQQFLKITEFFLKSRNFAKKRLKSVFFGQNTAK